MCGKYLWRWMDIYGGDNLLLICRVCKIDTDNNFRHGKLYWCRTAFCYYMNNGMILKYIFLYYGFEAFNCSVVCRKTGKVLKHCECWKCQLDIEKYPQNVKSINIVFRAGWRPPIYIFLVSSEFNFTNLQTSTYFWCIDNHNIRYGLQRN